MEQPIYFWTPDIAPAGIAFYSGRLVPGWRDNLFVCALAGKHLVRLVLQGNRVVAEERLLTELDARLRDVHEGPDGALYVMTDGNEGKILRLAPRSADGWNHERALSVGRFRSAVSALSRRGVGRAVARRPAPVRDADPRRRAGGTELDHDPAQARRLPEGVRSLRSAADRQVRREEAARAARRRGHRSQPAQDSRHGEERPGVPGRAGGVRLLRRLPLADSSAARRRSTGRGR